MELAPGEETFLEVEVQMTRDGGKRRVGCVLEAADGRQWSHVVETVAYPYLQFADRLENVAFGELDPGQRTERVLRVWLHAPGLNSAPPTIISVESGDPAVVCRVERYGPVEVLPDRSGTRRAAEVRVRVAASGESGPHAVPGCVRFAGEGISGERSFTISWVVRSRYELYPRRVHLGSVAKHASPFRRRVLIRRADGGAFRLVSAREDVPGVRVCAVEPGARGSSVITLEVSPGLLPEVFCGKVVLRTDDPLQPELSLVVSGRRRSGEASGEL